MSDDQTRKGSRMRRTENDFDPVSAALQHLHKAVSSEELPDDFLRILDEIDARIAAASASSSS